MQGRMDLPPHPWALVQASLAWRKELFLPPFNMLKNLIYTSGIVSSSFVSLLGCPQPAAAVTDSLEEKASRVRVHRPQQVPRVCTQILADPSPFPSTLITIRSTLQTYNRFYSSAGQASVSHVNRLLQKYQKLLELSLLKPRQHSPGENMLSPPCHPAGSGSQPVPLSNTHCSEEELYPQVQQRECSWVALPCRAKKAGANLVFASCQLKCFYFGRESASYNYY